MKKKIAFLVCSTLLLAACNDSSDDASSPGESKAKLSGITEQVDKNEVQKGDKETVEVDAAINDSNSDVQHMAFGASQNGPKKHFTLTLHSNDDNLFYTQDGKTCDVYQGHTHCQFNIYVPDNDDLGKKELWVTGSDIESNHDFFSVVKHLHPQSEKMTFKVSGLPKGQKVVIKAANSASAEKSIKMDNGEKTIKMSDEGHLSQARWHIAAERVDGHLPKVTPRFVITGKKDQQTINIQY